MVCEGPEASTLLLRPSPMVFRSPPLCPALPCARNGVGAGTGRESRQAGFCPAQGYCSLSGSSHESNTPPQCGKSNNLTRVHNKRSKSSSLTRDVANHEHGCEAEGSHQKAPNTEPCQSRWGDRRGARKVF